MMRVLLRPKNIRIPKPKIRAPKLAPRRPEIIVGIPTYNEVENIEALVKVLDAGLRKYFPDKKALIVIADSNSPDGTRKAFLNTRTRTPKMCMKSPRGKGKALRGIFEYFLSKESAQVLMLVDGDVTSVTVKWVRNLITPILNGFDHCLPLYKRNEYDSAVTDHIVYPILRGVLGIDIRQALGADVGLSRKAVDRIYNRKWPVKASRYGIDIFMTLSSVFGELRIAQADLGVKEHRLSEEPHIAFEEIVTTLLHLLGENKHFWDGKLRVRKPPIFFKSSGAKPSTPILNIDYKSLRTRSTIEFKKYKPDIRKIVGRKECDRLARIFKKGSRVSIDASEWMTIMFAFVRASDIPASKRAKLMYPLFMDRFLTVYKKYLDKDNRMLENEIVRQAEMFYKERKLLIAKKEG